MTVAGKFRNKYQASGAHGVKGLWVQSRGCVRGDSPGHTGGPFVVQRVGGSDPSTDRSRSFFQGLHREYTQVDRLQCSSLRPGSGHSQTHRVSTPRRESSGVTSRSSRARTPTAPSGRTSFARARNVSRRSCSRPWRNGHLNAWPRRDVPPHVTPRPGRRVRPRTAAPHPPVRP